MAATTQTVAKIVDMLGGMMVDSDTLQRVNDVPVARTLMNGVAEQLDVAHNSGNTSINPSLMSRAALKEIALEDMEVQALEGFSGDQPLPNPYITGYRLPSETQRELDYVRAETRHMEQQAEILNARTRQLLREARSTARGIRTLQDTHSIIQSTNTETTSRIDELSMHMDGIIADATQVGCSLLSSLESLPCDEYTLSFKNIHRTYSACAESITSHLNTAESSWDSLLMVAGIDADELDGLFRRYAPDVKFEDMPLSVQEYYKQEAYVAQVGRLCDQMECEGSYQTSSDVLADATRFAGMDHSSTTDEVFYTIPNPPVEIESSVVRDQIAYLNARGDFLDNVASAMEDSIMTPLNQLLSKLSLGKDIVDETEVLCGVLSEEVQSALDASSTSPRPPEVIQPSELREASKGVQDWEQKLENRLREYGPGHEGLFKVQSSLNSSHHSLLDAIYAKSPLNTSPPFAYSPHFMNLMEEAQAVTAQLSAETDRLTKEVESAIETRRTQRKLVAFVDQWTTS